MMTGTACLEDDRAAFFLFKELDHFVSPQLELQLQFADSIDGVNLEHRFDPTLFMLTAL